MKKHVMKKCAMVVSLMMITLATCIAQVSVKTAISSAADQALSLQKQLDLTAEQKAKVQALLEDEMKTKEYKNFADSLQIWTNEGRGDKVFNYLDAFNTKLLPLLTASQQKKQEELYTNQKKTLGGFFGLAAQSVLAPKTEKLLKPITDTITRNGFTLIFDIPYALDQDVKKKLVNLFFKVYPEEVSTFNKNASRTVIWHIGPKSQVAATVGNETWFHPDWFLDHPEDIDCATHELMHIVQAYGGRPGLPLWITEGIADYGRYKFGINNIKADWYLPGFASNQSYKNAYRVTARFFVWLEQHIQDRNIVTDLDKAMRDGTYSPDTWNKLTGKTVDQLWQDYAANPTAKLQYQ